jgi:phage-related protein
MSTFTWIPDLAPQGSHEPRMLKSPFGDGYTQRSGDGINCDLPTHSVSFSGRGTAEFLAIRSFLLALAPGEAFSWTPQLGTAAQFICPKWVETPFTNGISTHAITANFQQVPA